MAKQRSVGLDVVRSLAILCVLITHAIAYTGVLDVNLGSAIWTVWVVLRFIGMIGVPLFLLLSGYLCCEKTGGRAYLTGILPVAFSYLVISVICLAAQQITGAASYTPLTAFVGIFNYSLHGYAWYVEMYLGLFLLIPFLNLLWRSLDHKGHQKLVLTLLFLTVFPATLKSFRLFSVGMDILPDYWQALYPITYYYIGAYLHTHPLHLSRLRRFFLSVVPLALSCSLCYICTAIDGAYAWYMMNGFEAGTTALTAVGCFIFLYDIRLPGRILPHLATQVSLCSFEMYLFSYLTDQAINRFADHIGVEHRSVKWLMLVCGSFLLSYLLSRLFRLVSVPLCRRLRGRLIEKGKNKTEN